MFTSKTPVLGVASFLLAVQVAVASPVSWKVLSPIQRDVLKVHASHWNGYSETKQQQLLKESRSEVARKNAWKRWFNGQLSPQDRKEFITNKGQMTVSQFKQYMNSLFKKYGKPR